MKTIATIILVSCLIISPGWLSSQTKCKVLIPAISTTYEGKCKKGLANGQGTATGIDTYAGRFRKGVPNGLGTYTWASGAEYIGQWEFGERQGEGVYRFKYNGKDSTLAGIWKEDRYVGPVPATPIIMHSRNVQTYSLLRQSDGNKLTIEFFMNGANNTLIEKVSIISSNGSYQNYGDRLVFNYIMYPCTFNITYVTPNKMLTAKLDAVFEFEIFEPGNWNLRLIN
jgi:hypothetical protein|tara:strand:+ start:419 stop:1096 length:678 start_codon:yes stop_codon:yes gene_type:complete